jgi:general secretion pathway protein F
MGASASRGGVGLNDLIALNDEIVALVRAGVPLGRGLAGAGGELEGRLGGLAGRIGGRIDGGASLVEALEAEDEAIPPMYRAVIEAGVRAGRLPAALEGLATFARSVAELRSSFGLALIYPLLVLLVGHLMFIGVAVGLAPRLVETFDSMGLAVPAALRWLAGLGEWAAWWGPAPLVALLLAWLAWFWGGRARVLDPGRFGAGLGWIPWLREMRNNARAAMFAQLLALLLESRVPLPEALELAGNASGTARSRRGRAGSATEPGDLPPVLAWVLRTGVEQGGLVPALRRAADNYGRRAINRADLVRNLLPALLMVNIGGGAAILYALLLYVPFTELLKELAA